ncbi:MAG: discoidin domain-containing protein, partial [Bacteroidales bacterium]
MASRPARSRVRAAAFALAAAALTASFGQAVRSQDGASVSEVGAWLTTADRAHLLEPQPALSFAPDSGSSPLTIDVDVSTTYQEFDGAGASFTDSSAWLLYNALSATAREQLMMQLFDRSSGIGLSYLRQPIGASDFALSHYSYDDRPAGETDPTLAYFSIDHDRAYIIPALKRALEINPQLRVLASPWSPPAWMKSSGSFYGGHLNASAEDAYADYFVRFISAYEAAGVPIDRITPQNEPEYAPIDYPGMLMDSTQAAEFIGRHLGPALLSAGLHTRIDAWDHNWDNVTYAPSVFADPVAAPFVAGSAWHCYAGSPAAMTTVHDQYPGREIVFTECSGHADTKWTFSQGFARDMDMLTIGALRNWARTIVKWNIALDTNHGPHTGGCSNCTGLATIDQASGAVTFNYDYYSLGHISKFVMPRAVRIASNTFGSASIEDVAYKNPDGSTVLVVFNADTVSHGFKVREAGYSFNYTLPSLGAATFTWTVTGAAPPPAAPPTNLALGRPVVASSIENSSYAAANMVDGRTSTRWSSAFSDPQWIFVDLGSRFALSQVVINWEAAFAAAYQLQVSDDATTWTTFYSTSAGKGGTETIAPSGAATGRYVRVYCTTRTYVYGQQWGYSIWELQAYGTPATLPPPAPPPTNLALGRPVVASSIENSSYAAANMVDGRTSTRWSSALSDPQWIFVDLG